jgi:2'-hydroxyisoflavone reductase
MKNQKNESRRKFLQTTATIGAISPFVGLPNLWEHKEPAIEKAKKPLKILILGGTKYLGIHQINYALKRGHSISTFTRGKTKPSIHKEIFKDVEALVGDRNDNLKALENRKWDVVIDNSGRRVQWTKDTAELLKDNVGMYLYVSSVSVYYPYTGDDFTESRKLVREIPADAGNETRLYEYGVMKANSELAAEEAFGKDRTVVVRPTFIIGPGNPQNRFLHWTLRMERGGEILVPGKLTDEVQYIDVRDLSKFMITLLENKTAGTFNGVGPTNGMSSAAFAHGTHAAFGTPVSYHYANDHEFLKANDLNFMCPWVLPDGKFKGMTYASNKKSLEAGLTISPLAKTTWDIKNWWYSDAVEAERRKKFMEDANSIMNTEAKLIKAWKEWKKK